jgi:hypothetical protein
VATRNPREPPLPLALKYSFNTVGRASTTLEELKEQTCYWSALGHNLKQSKSHCDTRKMDGGGLGAVGLI